MRRLLPLYPAGRALDPDLAQRLEADWGRFKPLVGTGNVAQTTTGVFIDLNGDGTDEFVLLSAGGGLLYQNRGGRWKFIGRLYPEGMVAKWPILTQALPGGGMAAVAPPWKDLALGAYRYRMSPQRRTSSGSVFYCAALVTQPASVPVHSAGKR